LLQLADLFPYLTHLLNHILGEFPPGRAQLPNLAAHLVAPGAQLVPLGNGLASLSVKLQQLGKRVFFPP
jgi:hypothetical protein